MFKSALRVIAARFKSEGFDYKRLMTTPSAEGNGVCPGDFCVNSWVSDFEDTDTSLREVEEKVRRSINPSAPSRDEPPGRSLQRQTTINMALKMHFDFDQLIYPIPEKAPVPKRKLELLIDTTESEDDERQRLALLQEGSLADLKTLSTERAMTAAKSTVEGEPILLATETSCFYETARRIIGRRASHAGIAPSRIVIEPHFPKEYQGPGYLCTCDEGGLPEDTNGKYEAIEKQLFRDTELAASSGGRPSFPDEVEDLLPGDLRRADTLFEKMRNLQIQKEEAKGDRESESDYLSD